MAMTVTELLRSLSRRGPWVWVAVLAATGLFAYYGSAGVRLWNAQARAASLDSRLSQMAGRQPPLGTLDQELRDMRQRLSQVHEMFDYSSADELTAIVTATASELEIGLRSVAIGDPRQERQSGIQYGVLPMTVVLQADLPDILRFMSLLSRAVPVVHVEELILSDLVKAPSAQILLMFHLSPEPIPDEQETG